MTFENQYKKISKNFENPKIYALSSPHTNQLYIGSTCLSLPIRLRNHYELYKQYLKGNNNKRCTAFKLFELGNVNIETIDSCEDVCCKKALLKRERFWIENNNCVNKNITSRTAKESSKAHYENHKEEKKIYYQVNKEKRLQYAKDYINANKDKYNEYQKQYRLKQKLMREEINSSI
jgi:ribosomal protein S6